RNWRARTARAVRTGIAFGAHVAIVAGCTIGCIGVAAQPRVGIACARRVTLVLRRAHHRIGTGASARLAAVGLRAGVAVVAARAVVGGCVCDAADRIAAVGGAGVLVVDSRRDACQAGASIADVAFGAGV